MKPRHQRLLLIGGTLAILALAVTFVLRALDSNIALYITPSEVAAGKAPHDRLFRIGGLVKAGSVRRDGLDQTFIVTDRAHDITVRYQGILPDLFREDKGVVAQGRLQADGRFVASEVLAKHDENYMPPEAQHALDSARPGGPR